MALLSLNAHSQSYRDSTLIPNTQLRLALSKIEQGKFCAEQRAALQARVDLLEFQASLKDSTISTYQKMKALDTSIISSYRTERDNLLLQKKSLNTDMTQLNKSLRWQKTKTTLAAIAGGVGMVGVAVLLLFR